MQQISGKAAPVFQEIPGESVSARRVRYWKWKKAQAKLQGRQIEYSRDIADNRKTTISQLTKKFHELTRQVEAMQKELAKHGYTFKVGE